MLPGETLIPVAKPEALVDRGDQGSPHSCQCACNRNKANGRSRQIPCSWDIKSDGPNILGGQFEGEVCRLGRELS